MHKDGKWAKNIIAGTATESDYLLALSADPNAWQGSAHYIVEEAIEIAKAMENLSMMLAEHHKHGTTNQANKQKHEDGQRRKQMDQRGKKGDSRRKENRSNKRRKTQFETNESSAVESSIIMIGSGLAIIWIVANDVSGAGFADDVALAGLIPVFTASVEDLFS